MVKQEDTINKSIIVDKLIDVKKRIITTKELYECWKYIPNMEIPFSRTMLKLRTEEKTLKSLIN